MHSRCVQGAIHRIVLALDDKEGTTACSDGSCILWDLQTRKRRCILAAGSSVADACHSSDLSQLVTAGESLCLSHIWQGIFAMSSASKSLVVKWTVVMTRRKRHRSDHGAVAPDVLKGNGLPSISTLTGQASRSSSNARYLLCRSQQEARLLGLPHWRGHQGAGSFSDKPCAVRSSAPGWAYTRERWCRQGGEAVAVQ